ncbi:DUF3099 domain-containing protein [Wenjunlia tyrosinilytica]|uniref:Membrane protein n=1 Tax=Wenjunlia tyrosinilytica TaxID=1544741 RepID=A0A918DXY2_9ACTN|nr:DUF3099 domain-containing protein [Wenjunlia tyrosinilytica]GGO87279.1 membrane protein [Wenjunlia tyrosinilytica]
MYARRRRRYFVMMGLCLALFVLAWGVVRLWSVPLAVGMCVVAMIIPPVAAIMANRREPDDKWWDVPDDSWLEDEPEDDTWLREEQAAKERAARKRPDDSP